MAGVVCGLLLALNVLPRLMLVLLFVLYLSLFQAGQVFMNFQWDYLLLEAGFLGIFLPGGRITSYNVCYTKLLRSSPYSPPTPAGSPTGTSFRYSTRCDTPSSGCWRAMSYNFV